MLCFVEQINKGCAVADRSRTNDGVEPIAYVGLWRAKGGRVEREIYQERERDKGMEKRDEKGGHEEGEK